MGFKKEVSLALLKELKNKNLDKIYHYLYIIDVNEHKAQSVLNSLKSDEEKSSDLADLMITRQLKKLQKRP